MQPFTNEAGSRCRHRSSLRAHFSNAANIVVVCAAHLGKWQHESYTTTVLHLLTEGGKFPESPSASA